MNKDEIRKLIGGYASGTLTAAEQQQLFEAALDDQDLFDELQKEQPLKELLSDPASREQLRRRAAQFQPAFERYCPHLLDEMRGLGEGAGVSFEEAMSCNIRGELHYAPQAGCTAFAIQARGAARHGMLVGQNSDMGSEVIPLAYILRLKPQNKPEVLTYTFGGMIAYHGFNSAGVSKFENALGGGPPSRFGIPHYPVERMMYECKDLEEVYNLLRKMPLEYNVNFLMSDGQGNIADIESTTEGPQILREKAQERLDNLPKPVNVALELAQIA